LPLEEATCHEEAAMSKIISAIVSVLVATSPLHPLAGSDVSAQAQEGRRAVQKAAAPDEKPVEARKGGSDARGKRRAQPPPAAPPAWQAPPSQNFGGPS
jgi:hypothetical protein